MRAPRSARGGSEAWRAGRPACGGRVRAGRCGRRVGPELGGGGGQAWGGGGAAGRYYLRFRGRGPSLLQSPWERFNRVRTGVVPAVTPRLPGRRGSHASGQSRSSKKILHDGDGEAGDAGKGPFCGRFCPGNLTSVSPFRLPPRVEGKLPLVRKVCFILVSVALATVQFVTVPVFLVFNQPHISAGLWRAADV